MGCWAVLLGVQGVFRVRNGSGSAEKWKSVSPCFTAEGKLENEIRLSVPFLLSPATPGSGGGVALKAGAYTRPLFSTT